MGTEDHKDITDVLKAVQEIGRIQLLDPKAPNEDAATPAVAATQRLNTIESPSTSIDPAGRPLVSTPQVVPTLDPSPSTPHPSLHPPHIYPLAPPSLYPSYIHPLVCSITTCRNPMGTTCQSPMGIGTSSTIMPFFMTHSARCLG